MTTFTDWLSLAILLITGGVLAEIAWGVRQLRLLKTVEPLRPDELRGSSGSGSGTEVGAMPSVSIVVSALNEAQTLEPALRSLLKIEHPGLQVIAINDRSTDATPQILDRLATLDARLKVIHIDSLPAGWLGKNHALMAGSRQATGDYLLFTDADVVFEPSCVSRAVAHCEREQLHHVTVTPEMPVDDALLAMLLAGFSLGMLAIYKPWKVRGSATRSLGLGAFNLVRREAYERSGGHAAIAMQVLDDLMLGQLIKRHGGRQDVAMGQGMLSIAWYRSAAEMGRGLQKNLFAALGYRVSRLWVATAAILVFGVWPWLALFFTHGATWWFNLGALALVAVVQGAQLRVAGWPLRALGYLPAVPLISLALVWRASLATLWRGGIEWRGTFYPLKALRGQGPSP